MRSLVAAGAASGIAAAFNTPIAGVFFALEIILGEISGAAFGVVMLASVASAVFTQIVSGTQPAFHIPPYIYNINWQLPLHLILGLLAGPIASANIRTIIVHWGNTWWCFRANLWLYFPILGNKSCHIRHGGDGSCFSWHSSRSANCHYPAL